MTHRVCRRCLLTGTVLAVGLGLPIVDNPLTVPTAYAHHGGSGGSAGSGGGGGGGGGGGKSGAAPKVPEEGYGKGGHGPQGMKPSITPP